MWKDATGLQWLLDERDTRAVRLYKVALFAVAAVFFISMGVMLFAPGGEQ
jgi:hypothetical protein